MSHTRERVKRLLRVTRLAAVVRVSKYAARLVRHADFRRRELALWQEYWTWRRQHREVLRTALLPRGVPPRRVLLAGKGTVEGSKIELGLLKGLELAGFETTALTERQFAKFYRLAGVRDFVYLEDLNDAGLTAKAREIAFGARDLEEILPVEHAGARVGRFALSTTFRSLRVGRLDFGQDVTRRVLAEHLAAGMIRAAWSHRVLDKVRPDLTVFMGNRYTGQGELMDVSLSRGIDVLTWFDAHRANSLMLKRYSMKNRDQHHASLSDDSWELLRRMEWTDERRRELKAQIDDGYAVGDWYSRGGTQVNKRILPRAKLVARLGLDPGKKTAVIFPHIVWDATLFWGTDLFNNYEDWFVETVRAACGNPRVNWVIKIHPAHVAKNAMERYDGEPAELVAVRQRVGELPPHVRVIPPDTDINTYSLFSVMDYCLTVRGTIGIEAASFGARVLTAGTGRYDHRGFTIDSDTREQYLARLASIDRIPPLTSTEQDLARRFAYGAFVVRPLPLTTVSIEHERDIEATTRVRLHARSAADLERAADLRAFARWATDRSAEDFLWEFSRLLEASPAANTVSSAESVAR